MAEIANENDYNLNISRYVSTAVPEPEIILPDVHKSLVEIEKAINTTTDAHNEFLKQLGLRELP